MAIALSCQGSVGSLERDKRLFYSIESCCRCENVVELQYSECLGVGTRIVVLSREGGLVSCMLASGGSTKRRYTRMYAHAGEWQVLKERVWWVEVVVIGMVVGEWESGRLMRVGGKGSVVT